MKKIRFGVIGVGVMGANHARNIVNDKAGDFRLTAVADTNPAAARSVADELDVPCFTDGREMYDSGLIDAVIIATPHYMHGPLTIRAARAGIHVMCEKPLESRVGPARAMIAECRRRRVAFGAMLQHRARGIMIKAKQLIDGGALGEVFRVQLVCSSWFRTQAYYDRGAWRGTWDGEGGGVLINQAPHHLDLFQWIGGMPKRIHAVIGTREHKIEVEDTANIVCEYPRGKIGYIYATTAELPGMEQFIISGDKATMIIQKGKILLGRLGTPIRKFIYGSGASDAVASPKMKQKCAWREVSYPQRGGRSGHIEIVRGFVRHVLRGAPQYAPATEAINELELSNAAYISGYRNKPVDLPVDADEMDRLIRKLERQRSTGRGGGLRAAADRELRKLLGGR